MIDICGVLNKYPRTFTDFRKHLIGEDYRGEISDVVSLWGHIYTFLAEKEIYVELYALRRKRVYYEVDFDTKEDAIGSVLIKGTPEEAMVEAVERCFQYLESVIST